jgi:homopolymeric O-antigen transport system ATP-binding protein
LTRDYAKLTTHHLTTHPMSDVVIRAEGLGKKYLIGHQAQRERYTALRDVIARGARGLVRSAADLLRGRPLVAGHTVEEFWALKDVSFEVKRGEVVGIIGRNGAGKSTLLKILSRITEPSAGRVTIKGRVASLLEVGTGFHPELTGRENIYLNGAILGMTRAEIRAKFDEIVAFAEVERFLDTPVKRYSSGMYVRLAFAVAAHLEPEILVVDEVLAVGDAEFQRKCLGKMGEVAGGGRTVLFVSHNMNAVERLCIRVLHMDCGRLVGSYAEPRRATMAYLRHNSPAGNNTWRRNGRDHENSVFVPNSLEVITEAPDWLPGDAFPNTHHVNVSINGVVLADDPVLNIGIALYGEGGELLLWSFMKDAPEGSWPDIRPGAVSLQTRIPPRWLNEGDYTIELIAGLHCRSWSLQPGSSAPSVTFSIRGGLSDSPLWDFKRPGYLAPVIPWQTLRDSDRARVRAPQRSWNDHA